MTNPQDRRHFLKVAAAMTAGGLVAKETSAIPMQARRAGPPLPPPPNDLPPALQFQAGPGGTGSLSGRLGGSDKQKMPEVRDYTRRPADPRDLAFLPVHRLAALIRSRKLSPVELTKVYLERLQRLDKTLLCAVNILAETALEEAKAAEKEIEQGRYRGPLHGIPYGIKDLFATKNAPTTWGAKPFEKRVIEQDSTVVTRLRAAGAILIAKLATGILARGDQWFRGRTRNPWNPAQGSSGSSAGPASAVAAGCVGFAIGTETLGSIVSPSRRCSITSLRPTFGRVSRAGCMTLAWSMDKAGPMCRNAEDSALVFAAIHGADDGDPASVNMPFAWTRKPDLAKLRIGYAEGTSAALLASLKKIGARPKAIGRRPTAGRDMSILNVEAATAFDDFLSRNGDADQMLKNRVRGWRAMRETSAIDYLNAQRRRLTLMRQMDEFMAGLDVYIAPRGDLFLTNLTGHPSVVFPNGWGNSQPTTTTAVGALFADDKLLSVIAAYQEATGWHSFRPKLA